jgi:hypothetical protein
LQDAGADAVPPTVVKPEEKGVEMVRGVSFPHDACAPLALPLSASILPGEKKDPCSIVMLTACWEHVVVVCFAGRRKLGGDICGRIKGKGPRAPRHSLRTFELCYVHHPRNRLQETEEASNGKDAEVPAAMEEKLSEEEMRSAKLQEMQRLKLLELQKEQEKSLAEEGEAEVDDGKETGARVCPLPFREEPYTFDHTHI